MGTMNQTRLVWERVESTIAHFLAIWTDDNTIYYIGNAQGGELCRKKRTRITLETAMTCSVTRDWVSVELFSSESCIVGTQ